MLQSEKKKEEITVMKSKGKEPHPFVCNQKKFVTQNRVN